MTTKRLIERQNIAIAPGYASMIGNERSQGITIDRFVQDALYNYVHALVERETRRQVYVSHRWRSRIVLHPQNLSAQLVLTDDRHATRTYRPNPRSQR